MLLQISIQHFITIEKLLLDFSKGTTVITGETGTGKSILIDAIDLALGARAFENSIYPGKDKADISLLFDINKLEAAKHWLETHELSDTHSECLIRRSISRDGRSRSYINDKPVTLQALKALSILLINIHGQHEHQALLTSDKQREVLDRFADHANDIRNIQTLSHSIRSLEKKIAMLKQSNEEKKAQQSLLLFQLEEFNALQLQPKEFEKLDVEHKKLAHVDELLKYYQQILTLLSDQSDQTILSGIQQISQLFTLMQNLTPLFSAEIEAMQSIQLQLKEINTTMRYRLEKIEPDPERLMQLETRLSLLFNMARKYKIAPTELSEFQENLKKQLEEIEITLSFDKLLEELSLLKKQYQAAAKKLSLQRKKAALALSEALNPLMKELALPHAVFHILLDPEENHSFSPFGLEKIIFQMKTQKNVPLQALSKIASGGELSRISLAIHTVTAQEHPTPTLIFDEIDVGISGGTAEMVGKLIRRLGETHQVICVTHLPQVAAQGHHHVRVEKLKNETSNTHIQHLALDEKVQEIARMLGGIEVTQKTLDHAKEMVEKLY